MAECGAHVGALYVQYLTWIVFQFNTVLFQYDQKVNLSQMLL
jgi:hypothetical protein